MVTRYIRLLCSSLTRDPVLSHQQAQADYVLMRNNLEDASSRTVLPGFVSEVTAVGRQSVYGTVFGEWCLLFFAS
ncbi:hypothetical protein YC2023_024510 [Brassica napus]